MAYFDFERVAAQAGITAVDLVRIRGIASREFPGDEMMSDLHVLRACMAVRDGIATVAEVAGRTGLDDSGTPERL
jgi:hypothetical protein